MKIRQYIPDKQDYAFTEGKVNVYVFETRAPNWYIDDKEGWYRRHRYMLWCPRFNSADHCETFLAAQAQALRWLENLAGRTTDED